MSLSNDIREAKNVKKMFEEKIQRSSYCFGERNGHNPSFQKAVHHQKSFHVVLETKMDSILRPSLPEQD